MENSSAKNNNGKKIRTAPEGWPGADSDSPVCSDMDDLLAVVAEMAAGAAHELNNPLTVISGRAQLMREKAPTPEERKVWQQIIEQSQRISDIISDLMQFASPLPARPEKIDLEKLVVDIISFFSSTNPPNAAAVKFDKDIEKQAREIRADREQIEAVL
ncbi:MAG: hypothetical protein K8S55_11200, partial [Phycisphaerae bacterium]|nr:hypothetical protein [Phycisphaerae bacterium]